MIYFEFELSYLAPASYPRYFSSASIISVNKILMSMKEDDIAIDNMYTKNKLVK